MVIKALVFSFGAAACSIYAIQPLDPAKANALKFPAQQAKYVRLLIHESSGIQPCLDELEVYGLNGERNLALASDGAKATASSCIPGYPIHQIKHLNDHRYGNAHSWIAAGTSEEWAQIELPNVETVGRVVISRDREGRFQDRMPESLDVRLSLDGEEWKQVYSSRSGYSLAPTATWEERLRYAFLCEQETWAAIDPDDARVRVLKQMEAMIERLERRGMVLSREKENLERWRKKLAALPEGQGQAEIENDYLEIRMAKRQLFLREPDLAPLKRILFVARHPYEPSHNYSDILDAQWRPGGGIFVLEIPSRDGSLAPDLAKLTTLFNSGEGVARDAMASFDGKQIYFAHRTSAEEYFHLFSVNADGTGLRQLTEGPFHDYYPCPLPDGGLAFISTRCKARFLCWRPQAFVLFRMEADGSNLWPLSYANISEWAPTVMSDGRILWTRSEYLDKGADFGHTLWSIRPDGTHPELIFGNNTRYCFMNGREVPGTSEICATLISHGGDLNGPIALINPGLGRYNPEAVTNITPDTKPHQNMSWARDRCFRDPVPIARDYFVVSHAPRKLFGLYVIDRWGNRELLYLDPKISSMSPSILQPTPVPPVLTSIQPHLQAGTTGEFLVEDVYAGLEPAVPRGTVKFLRVCQELRADLERLPNDQYRKDHPPFEDFYASPTHLVRGPNGWPSYVAKGVLGTVQVEADGSARFEAPAGKVLYFQALDENFNEVQRMRSVVQLQPGEKRSCVGCHEGRATAARAHPAIAMRLPARTIDPPPWGAGPFSYERVVQPVWDAKCVQCHNARDSKGVNLSGAVDKDHVPASYRTLISQGWVHYFDMTWSLPHHKAEPLTFGTVRSKLWKVLEGNHHGARLTRDEMHRVKCWIDLNCPLWPDYQQRQLRPEPQLAETTP